MCIVAQMFRDSSVLIYIVSAYSNQAFGFFRASFDQSFPIGNQIDRKHFKVLSYLQFKCPGISGFPLVNLYVDALF